VSADRHGADAVTAETVLRPGEVRDTYSNDDGMVVLVEAAAGHRVVRLSPLGSAVLEAVGAGTTLGALEVELRSRLGEPPAGNLSELVLSATLALVDEDLIVAGQGHKDDNSGVIQP